MKISNTKDENDRIRKINFNEKMRPNINRFVMNNMNQNTNKPINVNVIYDNNIPYTKNNM